MTKRFFAVLCVLALLCQPAAMAEGITTPSDLPLYCEACGGEAQLAYTVDADGTHVAMCPHGVVDEGTRHEASTAEFVSVSDTVHHALCSCGIIVYQDTHSAPCTNPGVCKMCGATGVTMASQNHILDWENYERDDTHHWHVCLDCGSIVHEYEHYDTCTNPGVCKMCGATGVTMAWQEHNYDWENYEHDDTHHWLVCRDCGSIGYEYEHYDTCTNPGVCVDCGATGVTMASQNHSNYDWENYEHDDTHHWHVCLDCGSIVHEYEHYDTCTNPGVCVDCGATGVTMARQRHNYDWGNYEHDDTHHWRVCLDCGLIDLEYEHYDTCTNPGVCVDCGATGVTMASQEHNYDWENYEHDDTHHWLVCLDCGSIGYEYEHHDTCTNPGVCMECGATGVTMAWQDHNCDWEECKYDDTHHWLVCLDCGSIGYEYEHYDTCTNPGVCVECGATGVTMAWQNHNCDWEECKYDDTYHWWVCQDCGEIEKTTHYDSCTNPGVCGVCGVTDVTMANRAHNGLNSKHDSTHHWWECQECGEVFNEETHYMVCSDTTTGICFWCGEPCTKVVHEDLGDVQHDADAHWWVCNVCDQIVDKAAHVPSEDDPTKCAVCGAEVPVVEPTMAPTTEPTTEPTVEPTAEPTTEPTVEPTAEPTTEPTVEPTTEPTTAPTTEPTTEPTPTPVPTVTAAPKPVVTEAPAHEHAYDIAFVSNNDGTHSKTCTADDCDETITEACTLVTTDMGLMTCTACAKCGYAVYTAKAGVAALTEGENVPAVITRVETASIAPADGSAAAVVPADTALVVHETTFEVPVTLSEEIKGAVEKVFTAALIKDGESIQPSGQVKLRIPVDEETVASLEGKVLMLLKEDGTLVEIPFEIVDGEIVFLTEELGVFLLMTPENAD